MGTIHAIQGAVPNDRLCRIASQVERKFGREATLYAAVRAETAEKLGATERSRGWRIIESMLQRRESQRHRKRFFTF